AIPILNYSNGAPSTLKRLHRGKKADLLPAVRCRFNFRPIDGLDCSALLTQGSRTNGRFCLFAFGGFTIKPALGDVEIIPFGISAALFRIRAIGGPLLGPHDVPLAHAPSDLIRIFDMESEVV